MADADRLVAALNYLQEQKPADPLESFRSLAGLRDAYERRVQPIINNARQTFSTGGAIGDLLRSYGDAAAPGNAAALKGMGIPFKGPMTAPREEGFSSGENFRPMGDPQQQFAGQLLGDPMNVQPMIAPAARGAVAAGKYAGPELARGLENYMGRTGMQLNVAPKAIKDLMPTEYKSAMSIEPPHNVRDTKKLLSLTESMKNTGWQGRPILTYDVGRGEEALTGSHRIKAAREANIEVPIYRIENAGDYVDKNGKSILDVGFMELDDQVKWLNKFGDKNAAKLLKQEPEL